MPRCPPRLATPGKPQAFYIGCDSRGEYVYKFVSKKKWVPGDAERDDRLAVGAEYMDEGTIYAARFNADGSGSWLRLDAARATRMDRPEWTAVNPKNGEIYITMTKNPDRGNTTGISNNNFANPDLDPANPRYWRDTRASNSGGAATVQRGNVNGHIVRIREDGDSAGATSFKWDIFLFGAQAEADAGIDNVNWQQNVNISGLSAVNDLSQPDSCWLSQASGILWIETDDNTYTDVSNAMLLAAVPGKRGNGAGVAAYGPGGASARPRSATVMITKDDGGVIGL